MKKAVLLLGTLAVASLGLAQTTKLRIFVGGQQRPDVVKKITDIYEKRNPGVKIEIEVGGATSDQQQQYLTTVLASRDPSIDAILIDVIRPAQYAAARWAHSLDRYLPGVKKTELLKQYLPAYAQANQINGTLYALPSFADAQFLFYRKDLVAKYGFQPPKTWDDLIKQTQTILAGEKNPNLNGLGYIGANAEGTVCTFLLPVWAAGGDVDNDKGQLTLTEAQARNALQFWLDTMDKHKVSPANMAEKAQDVVRREMQAGNWVFGTLFSYAWARFELDADSQVKGKIGVVPLPQFAGGRSATCLGGWQWTVSDFSRNKAQAYQLVRFLTSPEASKILAIEASNLPVFPSLYKDPDVLKANPWFDQAQSVVVTARSRPVSARYAEISEAIRTNTNAVLARTKTPDAAAKDIMTRLSAIYGK